MLLSPPRPSHTPLPVRVLRGSPIVLLLIGLHSPAALAQDDLDSLFESESSLAPAPSPTATPRPNSQASVDTIRLAEDTPPAVSASPRRQLEEIVVTAQKTEQSLQDVPVSVSALTGEFIDEAGIGDLSQVAGYVPNIRVDVHDMGSPQVFIRGFGTNTLNPGFESSVGLVQDEIFLGRGGYFTDAMFDIERIEVLRGPQGTLFGKNTVAGVFNLVSAGPTEEFAGDVSLTYGSNGEQRFEAGLGGMINDWSGVRLSVLDRGFDGELYNTAQQRYDDYHEQQAYRLKALLYPRDSIEMELTHVKSDSTIGFWPYQLYQLDGGTQAYLSQFDPQVEGNADDFQSSQNVAGVMDKGSETSGLKTSWDIGNWGGISNLNSVLVLGYSTFYIDQLSDFDASPSDIMILNSHSRHDQTTIEWRATGSFDSLFGLGTGVDFVAGLYFYGAHDHIYPRLITGEDIFSYALTADALQLISGSNAGAAADLPVPGLAELAGLTGPVSEDDYYQLDFEQDTASYAFFGQASWFLNDRFSVIAGLRINYEDKQTHAQGQACPDKLGPCITEILLASEDYDYPDLERSETDISPKLALQYALTEDINIYTSYAKGYKSGGFNAISFTGEDLEFEPELTDTYEIGIKGQFFDRTLNINATAYRSEFDNLQVLAFNGVFFDVSNAASAYSQGLEMDLMWLTPYEPLSVTAAYGLLEARYHDYETAPAPISEGSGATQDLSGGRIAFAPKQTVTISPSLTYPLWGMSLGLAVDGIYIGDQYTDSDLDPNVFVEGYWSLSARMSLSSADRMWSFTLGGTNLTDQRERNLTTDATFFPGSYFAQQVPGRRLYATLAVNW